MADLARVVLCSPDAPRDHPHGLTLTWPSP
jgi:hypothetical protein